MAKKSKFEKWFEAQFGPRPKRSVSELVTEVYRLRSELKRAEEELRSTKGYYRDFTAALYSKNAAEKDFEYE